MPPTEKDLVPRLAPLRWIAETGASLAPEVARRLRLQIFGSTAPYFVATINTFSVCLFAYSRSGTTLLLVIALLDLLVLTVRLIAIKKRNTLSYASDLIYGAGILWAGLVCVTTFTIILCDDLLMSAVAIASGLGACAGIISRNFATPRYAMLQVTIIDISYKVPFCWKHPEFLPLLVLQGAIFMLMNRVMLAQQRRTTAQAITAEINSRDQAFTDPLTRLLNRRGLEDRLVQLQQKALPLALFYLDLDGFKTVNDRYGHAAGDRLLCEVAERLRSICPDEAICRLGGDEFLIVKTVADEADLRAIAARFVVSIGTPFRFDDCPIIAIGVSVGMTLLEPKGPFTTAMARADKALYRAKAQGKGQAVLCDTMVTPAGDTAQVA